MNHLNAYDEHKSMQYSPVTHFDKQNDSQPLIIRGDNMTIETLVQVARYYHEVKLSPDISVQERMEESISVINDVIEDALPLYGVTSLFGGLANRLVSTSFAKELQNNMILVHKAGAGAMLPLDSVRGAMLLRANAHLIGASGIRRLWDERLITFICERVTPIIPEFGSIGASGDLIPLSYIASAISGQDRKIKVDFRGEIISGPDALQRLGLSCEKFEPKEGLALLNGTSVMTASASLACYDLYTLMAATIHVHAMAYQALNGSNQPLHPFLHQIKGHQGQVCISNISCKLPKFGKIYGFACRAFDNSYLIVFNRLFETSLDHPHYSILRSSQTGSV